MDSVTERPRRPKPAANDPLAPSFTLLRVRGITIGAHWTWILVFGLWSWTLSGSIFPTSAPGLSRSTYLVMGIVAAAIFFICILLHELGHSFTAIREGMKVGDITLWLFGGVARFEGLFPSAGAEFRIAIAGPVVSVVLAGFFYLSSLLATPLSLPISIKVVVAYLAQINVIVVAFNMVPALPLDGGRVLRSWLWHKQRSFTSATIQAARAGKAFAYLLIGIGVLGLFSSAFTGGIWSIFLGWFLLQAAQGEAAFVLVRKAFHGLNVGDVMTENPVVVGPNLTINQFLDDVVRPQGHSSYPVIEDGGRLIGLVSLKMAGTVPAHHRDSVLLHAVMLPRDETPSFTRETPVMDAFSALRAGPGRGVVFDGEQVAGIISTSDISKVLELEQVRGLEIPEPGRRTGTLVWVVVIAALLTAAAAFYHPPLAVIAPGPTEDAARGIKIAGAPTTEVNGKYLLVTVRVEQPTGLGAIYAFVHPERDVIPLSSLIPEGTDPEEFSQQQRSIFVESRRLAAAAAAQAAGLNVVIEGTGARIRGVAQDAPAEGKIQVGDVITAADGEPIKTIFDLRRIVTSKPPGTTFAFTVERDGESRRVEIASKRYQEEGGLVAIGVIADSRDFNVDLPFEIEFPDEDIGGPSAGLAYALAITDILDPRDLAKGKTIAASGEISLDGNVSAVGGLIQKTESAEDAGANVFLIPSAELKQLGDTPIEIRGVTTLAQAIGILVAA